MDSKKVIEEYINQQNWRVNENSNSSYSISGLQGHISGAMITDYTLNNIYSEEISKAHRNCDFHIHDLSQGIAGYCAGWSFLDLLLRGFNGVEGRTAAKPAKHLSSLLGQTVNFLGTLQNEWAGAQAFSSIDTYCAPFIRYDKLSFEQVKQLLQEFIFGINQISRWGNQVPFTNLTFDLTVSDDLKDKNIIIGGKQQEEKYSDFQKEMDIFNKAFIEIMTEGDANGRIFTFPIPTYNLTKEFDWESDVAKLLFQMTSKYGTPYFQNFINSDLKPSDVRSLCCHLRLDKNELKKKTGALFGSGEKTGSIGVVTLNMPKLGFYSRKDSSFFDKEKQVVIFDEEKAKKTFFDKLEKLMILAKDSLEIKRKYISKRMKENLFPYSRGYLGSFVNHFSTIGLLGMHECCLNFLGKNKGIETKEGKAFSIEVLNFMREKEKEFQRETDNMFNIEASPAEGCSHRLAKHDLNRYEGIITSGTEKAPFYTNSTLLPVDYDGDIFDVLNHQDELQILYTGGTNQHLFLGESIQDWRTTKNLIKKVAYNYKLPYFTISPTFSICKNHGYIRGKVEKCPECDEETEIYSRIVGYYRPVKNWNNGKKEEFKQRKTYKIEND